MFIFPVAVTVVAVNVVAATVVADLAPLVASSISPPLISTVVIVEVAAQVILSTGNDTNK